METVANVAVVVVAAIHLGFLVLEMFLWNTPTGRGIFGTDEAFADQASALAANQGLYNGFLSAGLVWSVLASDPVGEQTGVFFLICVIVAGAYGAATVSPRILALQAAPAAVALGLVLAA